MPTLHNPLIFIMRALVPTATLYAAAHKNSLPACHPIAVLLKLRIERHIALNPKAVFLYPVVLAHIAQCPMAVLLPPEERTFPAPCPMIVLHPAAPPQAK